MGTKFGHFSVFNSNIDETVRILKSLPKSQSTFEKFEKMGKTWFDKSLEPLTEDKERALMQLFQLRDQSLNTYFVGINNRAITVFSEELGFENTEQLVKSISRRLQKSFMVLSVFDNDVLLLSIIKSGSVLTRHLSGDAEAYFGENTSLGDLGTIANELRIPEKRDLLERALKGDDPLKKVSDLETLLEMTLWIISEEEVTKMGWKKVTIK
jgi:hypothetical protein